MIRLFQHMCRGIHTWGAKAVPMVRHDPDIAFMDRQKGTRAVLGEGNALGNYQVERFPFKQTEASGTSYGVAIVA